MVTEGIASVGSNDGIEIAIGRAIDGIPGSGMFGRPGRLAAGIDRPGSNEGIGIATGTEMLGMPGSGIDGRPGNDSAGKPQLIGE